MDDAFLQTLRGWQNFYLLMGTAAATLIGLIFVAISLGAGLVIPDTTTTAHTWVTPTIVEFGMVLLISALINVPTLTSLSLAVLLGFTGGAGMVYAIVIGRRLWRHLRSKVQPLTSLVSYVLIPVAGYLLMLASAIGLALGLIYALSGLALAILIDLMISVYNAWQLALWLTTRHNQQ